MKSIIDAIKNNPVRLYAILLATIGLVANYWTDFPRELVDELIIAILFGGELVRNAVTPNDKVVVTQSMVQDVQHSRFTDDDLL